MKRTKLECNREELFDVNMMITFSVSVEGDLNRSQLEDAFYDTVRASEILNTKLVMDENGDVFYTECDTPKNGFYITGLSLPDLIKEQEKIRFRIEDGEFLRLFADDSSKENIRLHFLMHHTAGDGMSLSYFIENYFMCLGGEKPEYNSMLIMKGGDFPESGRIRLLEAYTGLLNLRWKRERHIFDFAESDKAFSSFWSCHETETEFKEINKEELEGLLTECHKRKISFTSYYAAVIFRDRPEKKQLGFAMNIRDPENRHMGNHAAGITVKYRYAYERSIWENAENINRIFKRKMSQPKTRYFALNFMLNLMPSLVDAVNMECAGYFHGKTSAELVRILGYDKSRPIVDTGISNMGVYDIKTEYGAFSIRKIIFVPPNVSYSREVTGLITVGGKLYVSRRKYRE